MIVSQFQAWAKAAPAPSRAEGVSALARALLYSNLSPDESRATVDALTDFLDDPSPLVRRAMADAFASAIEAPRPIVFALADDQPAIAAIVLSRSPLFSDAELIAFVTGSGSDAQGAVAARPYLSATVATALAQHANAAALVTLASNPGAEVSAAALAGMAARHGDHGTLRDVLLGRDDLPAAVRIDLVTATANALAAFVAERQWISGERVRRITREATERAAIVVAAAPALDDDEIGALARSLRAGGQVTVALVLRAVLSANLPLFGAMVGDLAGVDPARVDGLVRHAEGAGFAALYRKAGLPGALLPAIRLALASVHRLTAAAEVGAALVPGVIADVIAGCAARNADGQFDKLLGLLHRFESEAARECARTRPRPTASSAPRHPARVAAQGTTPVTAIDYDEAVPRERAAASPVPRRRVEIDLAALEAELLAA